MTSTLRSVLIWACLLAFISALPVLSQTNAARDAAIKEFKERAQQYMDLQKRVQDTVPPVDEVSHPELIVPRQKKLAESIRLVRMSAKQGDVFTPAVQPVLISIIRQELAGPTGQQARSKILGEGNPNSPSSGSKIKLAVNTPYPAEAPLATIPPFLLLMLPELPEGLEYRFVGRSLVLLDVKANLVVDILPQAVS